MKNLRQVELKNKKILLRTDFDVPVSEKGEIKEPFRIKKQKETLDYLISHGAKVVLAAHISDESAGRSFASLVPQLHILLGQEINFIKSVPEIEKYLENHTAPALLENIRQNKGEEKNDQKFAMALSRGFDIYVNNAFAVCHRNHASVSAITKFLPNYAGFLIEDELKNLQNIIDAPKEGKVLIMGGAKASTKIPVIKNFLNKVDKVLIGGVIANDFLKAKGEDIMDSVVDENSLEILAGLDLNNLQLIMPKDFNIFEKKILDIGPETIKEFSKTIKNSRMIIWNGPMGLFEDEKFAEGTRVMAEAIVNSGAVKIAGGGDTISAINRFGMFDKFDFISTGGGAMLSFLAEEELPGLRALGYYDQNDRAKNKN